MPRTRRQEAIGRYFLQGYLYVIATSAGRVVVFIEDDSTRDSLITRIENALANPGGVRTEPPDLAISMAR